MTIPVSTDTFTLNAISELSWCTFLKENRVACQGQLGHMLRRDYGTHEENYNVYP